MFSLHFPTHTVHHGADRDGVMHDAEHIISWVLRGGVLLSAGVIILGLALFAAEGARVHAFPHTLPAVMHGVTHGDPLSIVVLGLLLLLCTPVLRVAVSIIAFALEGDRRYVAITSLVLALLLLSMTVLGAISGGHPASPMPAETGVAFIGIFAASVVAGLVGALVGLGGGVFVVPLLAVGFGMPIEVAIGASIVSVIATSSGAAAAYVRDHLTNLRVGMFLEIATTLGAICGAFLAALLAPSALFVVFGGVLLASALPLIHKLGEDLPQGVTNDRWASRLALASSYPDPACGGDVAYAVTHVPSGFGLMTIAGLISGLLGIGSGTFKVLAMDVVMRLPMKVSSTTSNFMIGVTAAASAGIYFQRGAIQPLIAAPVALGVLAGAMAGAKVLP
ncbi:MAG TPA: TSUP family transporter, partial [Ktedonobacterales bacterium]|nr:TSUP family transporter [Ktedonobacterales bacterium]